MHPTLFKIGPLAISTYGVFVFLGVLAGYLAAFRQASREKIKPELFSHFVFWVMVFAFLGAKLLYILIEFRAFLDNPLAMVRSGFVFYGGIIAGMLAILYLSWRHRVRFLKLADIFAFGLPLGHAFGRVGCFFYGCCFGHAHEGWFGLLFPPDSPAGRDGVKVIPTQLIEAGFLFLLFFIFLRFRNRQKFSGQVFFLYIIAYGTFRFLIEFLRGDPRGSLFFFSTSQLVSLILVPLAIWFYCRALISIKKRI